jgi:hypothetical protein
MQERGVAVDHSSINRWAIRFLPLLEKAFRNHKHALGKSWRMDETYIKVKAGPAPQSIFRNPLACQIFHAADLPLRTIPSSQPRSSAVKLSTSFRFIAISLPTIFP